MPILDRLVRLLSALFLATASAFSATYYVSADADSSTADGSLSRPYRTIARAATRMAAGDTCLIRRGIYRETVVPAASGAAGRPVIFMAYPGEKAFVSAADPVTGWTLDQGKIYKAPLAWNLGKGRNQLFVNGEMMLEARLPNIDDQPTDQAGVNVFYAGKTTEFGKHLLHAATLTCNSHGRSTLPAAGQPHRVWVGVPVVSSGNFQMHTFFQNMRTSNAPQDYLAGALVMRTGAGYYSDHGTVVSGWGIETGSLCNGQLYISVDATTPVGNNWGFSGGGAILFGKRAFLDVEKEWALDNGMLYFRPPADGNPNTMLVEAKRRQMCMDLRGRNYIEVRGLYFMGGTINMDSCNNSTVDDCHLRYVTHWTLSPHYTNDRGKGESEISIRGNNNRFVNSTVEYSAASGLWVDGNGNLVENCLVTNCDYIGNYQVGIGVGATRGGTNTVTKCTMYNFGRSAMTFSGSARGMGSPQKIILNDMYNCQFYADDGGTFYCAGDAGGGTEFAYNWFHDMVRRYNGHHLYFDWSGGYHFLIHHNVFWQEKGGSPNNAITSAPMRVCTYNNTSISVDPWLPYGSYLAYDDDERGVNALWANNDPAGWGIKDWRNHDFTLVQGSKAIDVGNFRADSQYLHLVDFPSYASECFELDTPIVVPDSSVVGTRPDLGAYEYGKPRWIPGCADSVKNYSWVYPPSTAVTGGPARTRGAGVRTECVLGGKGLLVSLTGAPSFTVRVLDISGRTVVSQRFDRQTRAIIPASSLPATVLLVRLSAGEVTRTYRVVR